MKLKEEYEVLVVGAGPAGSTAAKKLAEEGVDVALLEKAASPGTKNACGSNLTVWGVTYAPYVLDGPIESVGRVARWYYIDESGAYIVYEVDFALDILFSIKRTRFDKWHAELAAKAGADLHTSTTVVDVLRKGNAITGVVTDSGKEIKSKVVIDAAGAHSIVARKTGLLKPRLDWGNILYATAFVKLPKRVLDLNFGCLNGGHAREWYLVPGGCRYGMNWAFPGYGGVHIGAGGGYMTSDLNVKETVWAFLNNPFIRKKLAGGEITYWGARCDPETIIDKTYAPGLLITGASAGFTQQLIGEGIAFAFMSGTFAAQTALEALKKGDASEEVLKGYEEKWKSDFVFNTALHTGEILRAMETKRSQTEVIQTMRSLGLWYAHAVPFLIEEAFVDKDMEKAGEALGFIKLSQMFVDTLVPNCWDIINKARGQKFEQQQRR